MIFMKKNFDAFALLEIAIALCVLGIVNYAGMAMFNKMKQNQHLKVTMQNQEYVTRALAAYVLVNNKLPCPSLKNGEALSVCELDELAVGYIPYKTIGVPEEIAKDGLNHWMTYAINTSLASNWLVDIDTDDLSVVNPARTFCGAISANNLFIKNEYEEDLVKMPDYTAFVLIAHGKSGGFYLDDGSIQNCSSNDKEKLANARRLNKYYKKQKVQKDNVVYDDTVTFVSRNNLMANWAQKTCRAH